MYCRKDRKLGWKLVRKHENFFNYHEKKKTALQKEPITITVRNVFHFEKPKKNCFLYKQGILCHC